MGVEGPKTVRMACRCAKCRSHMKALIVGQALETNDRKRTNALVVRFFVMPHARTCRLRDASRHTIATTGREKVLVQLVSSMKTKSTPSPVPSSFVLTKNDS